MGKYYIIGNMTGNSMDAIDLVLTEFDGDIMRDICTYTKPYDKKMQEDIEKLRLQAFNKTAAELEQLPEFRQIHDEYITQIADCINEMCRLHKIDKTTVNAIGFHGKTLDHNPPSKASRDKTQPYTLQIGSGQMLADLTEIPTVYDFRSDFIFAGFEGAPLVSPHNAHIAATEGNGCYYNGGNTSNFAIIKDKKALIAADSGPFNEYIDGYVRLHTAKAFDEDGMYGQKGKLNKELLQELFNIGRSYYETPLPKSGDPAYYHKQEVFSYVKANNIQFEDAVHTFEYFAAYIAFQALSLVPEDIAIPDKIILFGGGWKNPVVTGSFEKLLKQQGFVLPEHKEQFSLLCKRLPSNLSVRLSSLGDYMEARLFADLARCKLENKGWEIPEIVEAKKTVVCGRIALPNVRQKDYTDRINRAAKGWQA